MIHFFLREPEIASLGLIERDSFTILCMYDTYNSHETVRIGVDIRMLAGNADFQDQSMYVE